MRAIHIGNIRVLDEINPIFTKGVILVKDVEFYYTRFNKMVCLDNGVYINNKREALDDYEFLTQTNQRPTRLLYMEDIDVYKVTDQEFKDRIKTMKKNRKK